MSKPIGSPVENVPPGPEKKAGEPLKTRHDGHVAMVQPRRLNLIVGAVLALLLLVVFALPAPAGNSADQVTLVGLPPVTFGTNADTTAVTRIDSNTVTGKRAFLVHMVVNSQDVYMLVRLQRASNGMFLDLVADSSAANLDAQITAMDFSATSIGHPSPTRDATDDALGDGLGSWNGY
jgi:hypothetical protein